MAAKATFQDEPIVDINVVPLVDIVLVLLIVFMVTANFMAKPAIDLELPKADTAEHKERNQFSIQLDPNGSVAIGDTYLNDKQVLAEFKRLFAAYKREKRKNAKAQGRSISDNQAALLTQKEFTMIIEADKKVSHGRIIYFIDLARRTGIYKYAFNVDPTN